MLRLYKFEYGIIGVSDTYVASETLEEAMAAMRIEKAGLTPECIRSIVSDFYLVGQENEDRR